MTGGALPGTFVGGIACRFRLTEKIWNVSGGGDIDGPGLPESMVQNRKAFEIALECFSLAGRVSVNARRETADLVQCLPAESQ